LLIRSHDLPKRHPLFLEDEPTVSKPALLYAPHGHELGGALHAVTIANRLADRFRVVMLNDGILPIDSGMTVSPDIEFVQLPVLGVDSGSGDAGIDASSSLQRDIALRRETILEVYSRLEPRVLLIENFPFGHSKRGDELMPTIEKARSGGSTQPLVVCSVTDAMSGGRRDEQSDDDETAALLNEYFDAVLVHSDPAFARLEAFFQPRNALSTPVHHTGFVLRDRQNMLSAGSREWRVLVSAGDGRAGGQLYRAALEAHRLLWDVDRLCMTVVAGPSLPSDEWQDLVKAARQLPELTLKRSVPDLGAEFAKVRWVVCPCDYDTASDVLATKVSALFVPRGTSDAPEQIDRAQRLAYRGVCRTLMPHHLNGASVANGIHQLIRFEPAKTNFNLDGAKISANLIQNLWVSQNLRSMLQGFRIRSDQTH
jgi:predicted glycosyltransferase